MPGALVLLLLTALSAFTPTQSRLPVTAVPASDGAWVVEGAGREADVRVAPFLGRNAVWLRNGTHAIRAGADFSDGTIEFDVAPMDRADFVAVVFRRESLAHHENLYLRVRQSGRHMALQYAPRTNGSSTWQLYQEFNVATDWPRNEWTHVRIEIRGSLLEVFVGNATSPALRVPRLRLDVPAGPVAFWARVSDQPAEWAAAISNLQVRPAPPAPRVAPPSPPAGFIARWDVAGPVPAAADSPTLPADLEWKTLQAEDSGLVNLNRTFRVQRGRFTAFARTTIPSQTARRVRAGIGYSDDVTVFLNGEPVYSGVNGWESRGPEYASFVDPRFELAWLPLRAGDNELMLAVTDDLRFGWGFAVRIDP